MTTLAPPEYTILQARREIANLRGVIAHLLASATLGNLSITGALGSVWTNITPDGGWTSAAGFDPPRYRLLAANILMLSGAMSRAAFTANTNLNSANPLPSTCWPTNTHHYRGVDNLSVATVRAGVQINSTGVIEALTNGTSCTFIEIDGIIPLD